MHQIHSPYTKLTISFFAYHLLDLTFPLDVHCKICRDEEEKKTNERQQFEWTFRTASDRLHSWWNAAFPSDALYCYVFLPKFFQMRQLLLRNYGKSRNNEYGITFFPYTMCTRIVFYQEKQKNSDLLGAYSITTDCVVFIVLQLCAKYFDWNGLHCVRVFYFTCTQIVYGNVRCYSLPSTISFYCRSIFSFKQKNAIYEKTCINWSSFFFQKRKKGKI